MPDRPQAAAKIGDRVDHYLLTGLIASGGMGSVFVARDERLGRDVALKLLPPHLSYDRVFRTRFEREYKIAGAIRHPNIIPIYDAGDWQDQLYIAMLLVEGPNLAELLKRQSPLPVPRVISIVEQVASALEAAHGQGIVHRDVKPANILLLEGRGAGGADHVYLVDFGLIRTEDTMTELTRSGSFLGTLLYVAPEQLTGGEIDGRADEYSLAATTFEMLASRPPFQRDNEFALINAHMNDPVPRLIDARPDLPQTMSDVLERAMAKSPDGRFTTVTAFARALAAGAAEHERVAAAATVAAAPAAAAAATIAATAPPRPVSPPPPTARPPASVGTTTTTTGGRSRGVGAMIALMVLAGLAVLLALGFGLSSLLAGGSPGPSATRVALGSFQPSPGDSSPSLTSPGTSPSFLSSPGETPTGPTAQPTAGHTPRPTPRATPRVTPLPSVTPAATPIASPPPAGLPAVRPGTWFVTNTLQSVDGSPHYTLGDHNRRYVVTPDCASAATCRLAVVSYDAQTGAKLGNIVYRWDGTAFDYTGDAGYFRQAGGGSCETASGDLVTNAYRTREVVRLVPRSLADTTRLTGTKVISGTPTAAGSAAGCAPFALHYDADMTFTSNP